MKIFDYIIVGKGIAGLILAEQLSAKNQKLLIYSNPHMPASSLVAGGMFNPVTGKYLAKTWLADELYDYLFSYYSSLEKKLDSNFFNPVGVFRPFTNNENKEYFKLQTDKNKLEDYIETKENFPQNSIIAELGGLLTKKAGWVNVPVLLSSLENYLKSIGVAFLEEEFEYDQLVTLNNKVKYKDIESKGLIFSEGFYAKNNPFFNSLPFNPVKGETLLAHVKNYEVSQIVNQNKWIMPIGKDKIRIGATYSWHELDHVPTEKAKTELLSKISKFLKTTPEIYDHQAGIRPSTKDRRPFLGLHPNIPNLFCFNGLGTKGVSLAPYFANQMTDFILEKKLIHPEANIQRFYALFS
jgi:glycine/D-amino acid oxidase-like deaminating enzyme